MESNQRSLTSLKFWSLYLISENSKEKFFIDCSYWKIRMLESQARHEIIDNRCNVKNTYEIVLECNEGYLVEEGDL